MTSWCMGATSSVPRRAPRCSCCVSAAAKRPGTGHPVMYLRHETDPDIIYVFATKSGAPTHPDWYRNLTAAGDGSVERGTETYKVNVRELKGAEQDRIYAEQARRYPGYAEYPRRTAGIRTIPVLELRRA